MYVTKCGLFVYHPTPYMSDLRVQIAHIYGMQHNASSSAICNATNFYLPLFSVSLVFTDSYFLKELTKYQNVFFHQAEVICTFIESLI